MIRKYIYYRNTYIYAIYCKCNNTLYYNLDFKGSTQLIVIQYK
nr:MAG TPA: hypothetical protein [Caudoviricetes sp.]